jgi:uncharacterized protein (DUF983 family)
MLHRKESSRLKKLWLGLTVRCPNCEEGRMFSGLFKINDTCPVCGVKFERRDGESLGGMTYMLGTAELISIGGFFLIHWLFEPPILPHAIFWVVFIILFCVLLYRNGRGLWVATSYLTGGVYKDGEEPEEKKQKIDWTKFNP